MTVASTTTPTTDTNAQLLRALTSLKDLRARLEAAESASSEPIAIIGMGCRLPGAANPDELWQLVRSGGDAITEIPRRPLAQRAAVRRRPRCRWQGGDSLGRLPARHRPLRCRSFFGISPREAVQMDPQQRLLLEVAWEALEDAGHAPSTASPAATRACSSASTATAPTTTCCRPPTRPRSTCSAAPGRRTASPAGRLSYLLDLRGPSLAIDTACSSSLVAVHLAVQSLRSREMLDWRSPAASTLILEPDVHDGWRRACG